MPYYTVTLIANAPDMTKIVEDFKILYITGKLDVGTGKQKIAEYYIKGIELRLDSRDDK